jgi:hypothetical protein
MQKIFFALLVLSITFCPFGICQINADDTVAYKMTQPAPNVFRIVGLKTTGHTMNEGFGDAFEQAIQVIGSKYKIISIEPINYLRYQTGSQTREIYVIVEEKNK